MNFKIIAVDFDGTLCKNDYPNIGQPEKVMIDWVSTQQKAGNKIILWTCREDDLLDEAIHWCKGVGLVFDAVNENLPEIQEMHKCNPRKIIADMYIFCDKPANYASVIKQYETKEDLLDKSIWYSKKERLISRGREELDRICKENRCNLFARIAYKTAYHAFEYLTSYISYYASDEDYRELVRKALDRLLMGKLPTSIESSEIYDCRLGYLSSLQKMIESDSYVTSKGNSRFEFVEVLNSDLRVTTNYAQAYKNISDYLNAAVEITMPYMPSSEPYKVIIERVNEPGLYLLRIICIIHLNEKTENLNLHFKYNPQIKDFEKIPSCDYYDMIKHYEIEEEQRKLQLVRAIEQETERNLNHD